MTEPTGTPEVPSGTEDDASLLNHWHGRLTREIRQMRDCGPLEAMQRLDTLVRSAVMEGGAPSTRALGLAWVQVLAGPPETLTVPLIRAAGSLHIFAARGPLLAHVYGDGFWPALVPDHPESRFTDLQRRAVLLALADLAQPGGREADLLHPALADWLLNRAVPLWRKARPGLLNRTLQRIGIGSQPPQPLPVVHPSDPADPVPGLTLRELRSHAFVLGRRCPRNQEIPYATLLAHCPVPIQTSEGGSGLEILDEGLHGDFLRGWLTENHQASLNGHPERLIQILPTPFATDGRLLKQIAAHLEEDFARHPNPLGSADGKVE